MENRLVLAIQSKGILIKAQKPLCWGATKIRCVCVCFLFSRMYNNSKFQWARKKAHTHTQKLYFILVCKFCQRTHTFANMCNLIATIHIFLASHFPRNQFFLFLTSHALHWFVVLLSFLSQWLLLLFRFYFIFNGEYMLDFFLLFLLLLSLVVVVLWCCYLLLRL